MKDMGAGSLSAALGARDLFPSEPSSMPSSLRNKLAALPPPPVVLEGRQLSRPPKKSRQISTSLLPNGREDLMALRRATLLKFIDEKDPDKKNKLESKIDAIDRKLEAQKKIPSTWPTFVAPPPTTTSEVRGDIARLVKESSTTPSGATGNTRWARNEAVDADRNLGKVLRVGDKSYNGWKDSYGSGSTKIGEGNFGTVIRNPDGTFVKRGAVSSTEAQIINRLGKIDLGPKLIAADINGLHQYMASPGVSVREGRIAMSGVEGKPLGVRSSAYTKFNGEYAPNVYWKAMAELHRQGIAHNDAHPDNILVDSKGKGRWVDLGLAQSSPKAALAEALGSFTGPKGEKPTNATPATVMNSSIRVDPGKGNWQTRRWAATGIEELELSGKNSKNLAEYRKEMPVVAKILDNKSRVNELLKTKYKLNDKDIETLYTTSIRSPISSYNQGVWGKLTDKQAQDLINQMYKGV